MRKYLYIIIATLFLSGCGPAGCGSKKDTAPTDVPAGTPSDPAVILSAPVKFDERSVEETLRLVCGDRILSPVEAAQAIVVAESAINHLSRILDQLMANEDNADTWHVLTELSRERWPGNTRDIIYALERQPLDQAETLRVAGLNKSLEYVMELDSELSTKVKITSLFGAVGNGADV